MVYLKSTDPADAKPGDFLLQKSPFEKERAQNVYTLFICVKDKVFNECHRWTSVMTFCDDPEIIDGKSTPELIARFSTPKARGGGMVTIMREKIIQYLQNIKCEWFPVEWDPFIYNYLGTQNIYCWPLKVRKGYSQEELETVKIKYEFELKGYSVGLNWKGDDTHFINFLDGFYCHYFTIDRCKLLLLNAVRSVIKSNDPAGHPRDYRVYISVGGTIKIFSSPKGGAWETVVWENGEFK